MTEQAKTLAERIYADIAKLENTTQQGLPAHGSWPKAVHAFDATSTAALRTALAAGRPLLLRGEPGTGKSQLARAAAYALHRLFVYQVIDAHTESQDLLWRFDAVARLAEAQALQGAGQDTELRKKLLASQRFISPGPLWWALDYASAQAVYAESQYQLEAPERPKTAWQAGQGSVLLIDEIDKANLELPNGLLEILGNNAVRIPFLNETIGGEEQLPPLVIITTNEERELPAAFIRRCLVLQLDLPKDDEAFLSLMVERAQLHFGTACDKSIYHSAAELLLRERKRAQDKRLPNRPGQAEYLDMLRALVVLGDKNPQQHAAMLQTISQFTLRKYPQMLGD